MWEHNMWYAPLPFDLLTDDVKSTVIHSRHTPHGGDISSRVSYLQSSLHIDLHKRYNCYRL